MVLADTIGEEKVTGSVFATMTGKKTLFSGLTNVHCILYFTSRRVVVRKVRSQAGDRSVPGWMEAASEGLKTVNINQIIDSDPKNFFSIPYSSMVRVTIGRKWLN